jgi:hypothetical protein
VSSKPKVRKVRLALLLPLVPGLALSGCATQAPQVQINLPQSLKDPCERAEIGPLATVGDLGALVIRQEAAVSICDAKRDAVVSIVDAYNQSAKPKRWFWQR